MPQASRGIPQGHDRASQPCPSCGRPVHPVAGRCKHCKTEVTGARDGERSGRAAEAAPASAGGPRPALAASWATAWPLVVGGISLLVIGASLGVLLERRARAPSRIRTAAPSPTPRLVPDDMPEPGPPRSARGERPAEDELVPALATALCERLRSCGITVDRGDCERGARRAVPIPDEDARCRFDAAVAHACVDAARSVACRAPAPGDVESIARTPALEVCAAAYTCDRD